MPLHHQPANPLNSRVTAVPALAPCFSPNQIRWAAGHDWFVGVSPSGLIVCNDDCVLDGRFFRESVSFSDFRALRDWAGY